MTIRMERLIFELKSNGDYRIFNKKEEKIGDIQRLRVGQFMQFCYTNVPSKDIFVSPGCQDEIREMCRILKGRELKNSVKKDQTAQDSAIKDKSTPSSIRLEHCPDTAEVRGSNPLGYINKDKHAQNKKEHEK